MINLTAAYDTTPAAIQNVSSVIVEKKFSGITMGNDRVSLLATEDTTGPIIGESNLVFNIAVMKIPSDISLL